MAGDLAGVSAGVPGGMSARSVTPSQHYNTISQRYNTISQHSRLLVRTIILLVSTIIPLVSTIMLLVIFGAHLDRGLGGGLGRGAGRHERAKRVPPPPT